MKKWAYFNEIEPYAAAWLRNLMAAGHVAPGVVDERSILDVSPDDIRSFKQCHFFAGIGVWSAALRAAGWDDDREVWSGSAPCQPFSAAGKGGGFDDERHLWPAFEWLIGQRRPDVVLGEQVEGPAGRAWLDVVLSDLEGHGYACGAAVFPAAGVGAPHIRHRTYWLADANHARSQGWVGVLERPDQRAPGARGLAGLVALPDGRQRDRLAGGEGCEPDRAPGGRIEGDRGSAGDRAAGGVADAEGERERPNEPRRDRGEAKQLARAEPGRDGRDNGATGDRPGPTNGVWRDADWLLCRDGKWRPVEPGSFPLAHGATSRVGRLRAYGNAVVLQAAQTFIESYLEIAG